MASARAAGLRDVQGMGFDGAPQRLGQRAVEESLMLRHAMRPVSTWGRTLRPGCTLDTPARLDRRCAFASPGHATARGDGSHAPLTLGTRTRRASPRPARGWTRGRSVRDRTISPLRCATLWGEERDDETAGRDIFLSGRQQKATSRPAVLAGAAILWSAFGNAIVAVAGMQPKW